MLQETSGEHLRQVKSRAALRVEGVHLGDEAILDRQDVEDEPFIAGNPSHEVLLAFGPG